MQKQHTLNLSKYKEYKNNAGGNISTFTTNKTAIIVALNIPNAEIGMTSDKLVAKNAPMVVKLVTKIALDALREVYNTLANVDPETVSRGSN